MLHGGGLEALLAQLDQLLSELHDARVDDTFVSPGEVIEKGGCKDGLNHVDKW